MVISFHFISTSLAIPSPTKIIESKCTESVVFHETVFKLHCNWIFFEGFHKWRANQHLYFLKSFIYQVPLLIWTKKNLWTNSTWGFEHVLDTMNYYWLCPDKNFPPQSTATRWRCNHFFKKWPKSKSKLLLPQLSVSEIFLGCTILQIQIFCR